MTKPRAEGVADAPGPSVDVTQRITRGVAYGFRPRLGNRAMVQSEYDFLFVSRSFTAGTGSVDGAGGS